jgi:hypothetical protein
MSDLNVAASALGLYTKYFEHQEKKIEEQLGKLEDSNRQIQKLSDIMNELSHAKRRKEPLDLVKNPALLRDILEIHAAHPTVFGDLISGLRGVDLTKPLEEILPTLKLQVLKTDDIECVIQALDGELKRHSSDVSEHMLRINRAYDDRGRMVEQGKRMLEGNEGEIKHILSKTANG